jgi:hypothetical protein
MKGCQTVDQKNLIYICLMARVYSALIPRSPNDESSMLENYSILFASLSTNSLYIHTVYIHPSHDKDLRQD